MERLKLVRARNLENFNITKVHLEKLLILNPPASLVQLTTFLEQLNSSHKAIDQLCDQLQPLVPDEELDTEIDLQCRLRNEVITLRVETETRKEELKLGPIQPKFTAPEETFPMASPGLLTRLPRLEMTRFGRDIFEWNAFCTLSECAAVFLRQ